MDDKPTTPPSEQRLQAYLDQVILRVFNSSPGLASYIESSQVLAGDGVVEISFYKVPEEIIPGIQQAFGIPEVEIFRYTKQGKPCVGFRGHPSREDLSALAVDDGDSESDKLQIDPDGLEDENTEVEKEADDMLKAPGQPSPI